MIARANPQEAAAAHKHISDATGIWVDQHILDVPNVVAVPVVNGCSFDPSGRDQSRSAGDSNMSGRCLTLDLDHRR